MDALKEGGHLAKKYGGCYWSVYCGRIVGVNIGLFDYWASIIGRPDGRGNVYIFVKATRGEHVEFGDLFKGF